MKPRVRRLLDIGFLTLLLAVGIVAATQHGNGGASGRLLDPAAHVGEGPEAEEHAREAIARYARAHPARAAAADPQYASKNSDGEAGSGGRAVAYHAGGEPLSAAAVTGRAPDARLFRTGFGSWEPSIGITKDGTIYVAARNSNVDPGVARSADDGVTWTHSNPSEHAASLDPFVWVDRATGRVFSSDISPTVTCAPTSYSDDGGKEWSTTRVCGHTDYQKVFGGPPPATGTKPQGYPDVVYFCAISGGEGAQSSTINSCSRSLDGGKSFSLTAEPSYPLRASPPGSPAANPNCDGGAAPGVVDAKGAVYVPRSWCGEPWLAISHDEGDSWTRVRVPGKATPYDAENSTWTNDSGVAVDRDLNLYYVWVAEDRHPYLSRSSDGGKTWTTPLDILPPGATRTSNPAIDVGDPGKIAISFVGTDDPPSTPADKTRWNAYLAQSTDALTANPTFYAARVNDPATNAMWIGACSPIRCGNMGDFYDVTIGPDGTPRGIFTDSCPGKDECITDTTIATPRGEGVLGQLVGGPPLVGTAADQQPQVTLPPASKTCRSRRSFTIRLHEPRRGRLRRASVYVDGRRVKVVTGRRLRARIDLRGLPKGRYRVRIVAVTTTGRRVVRTRTYRTCAVARSRHG